MAEERFLLTQTGYDQLKIELDDLEQKQREHQQDYADTNYSSDPSHEEAAYDEVHNVKDELEEQIGHLKLVLQFADIVGEDKDPKRVDPGERVTVWDLDTKEVSQFDLIGGEEITHGREGVALDSPVGMALLGRRIGDIVDVQIPDGHVRYAIRKIEPIPPGE